jgi:hypothetical protein
LLLFFLMQGPFDFALLGANKQVLRVRLPQLRSSDLGIQFALPQPAPGNATAAAAAAPKAEEKPGATTNTATDAKP